MMIRGKTLNLRRGTFTQTDSSAGKDDVHLLLTVSCCYRTKPFLFSFLLN